MDKPEREQNYIDCPECEKQIPIAWWGFEDNVHFCEDCKLLKTIKKDVETENEA